MTRLVPRPGRPAAKIDRAFSAAERATVLDDIGGWDRAVDDHEQLMHLQLMHLQLMHLQLMHLQLMHRMVTWEPGEGATSRFRMLPLHRAMEGFLALHVHGPEGCHTVG